MEHGGPAVLTQNWRQGNLTGSDNHQKRERSVRPTKLMQAWRQRGGTAIGGEEMLLYQAMVQVCLMTGIWNNDPPSGMINQDRTARLEQAMRIALEEAL